MHPVHYKTQDASIPAASTDEKSRGVDDTAIDATTSEAPKRKPHRQQKGVQPSRRSLRLGRQCHVTHVACCRIHFQTYTYVHLHSINASHIFKVVFLPKTLSQLSQEPVELLNQRKSPLPGVIINASLHVMLWHVHTVDLPLWLTCLLETYILHRYISYRCRRK